MDGIRPGACMLWKPAGGGVSALVTVMALDLDRDRVQVHVPRAMTGTCASHWVDSSTLTEGPKNAQPCGCPVKAAVAEKAGADPNAA